MFNKKKKVQKSFETISEHIDSTTLSGDEKRNLKGLLRNVKIRTGVA
ncbi:hypothetical protein [Streptococcus equi]|nr:hypothetical protein [Streptococcus equi]MCD3371761.1 hypothetical protein [Streptococcus equi subsp. zooepidemicus]MCD3373097.1 hypothetical protein [Streptococcus equi subsp. zooepidemicus]MCD3373117.1 hypothetical protein [Streptococcus equi subsp. zooepidemicus]MCD3373125.1 hypothetical protein [Streptococcus equi subsp. zooepidemicus]MCD3385088.1 hypothetical protein [Streptococcus equi subsp. zooepidemicus]